MLLLDSGIACNFDFVRAASPEILQLWSNVYCLALMKTNRNVSSFIWPLLFSHQESRMWTLFSETKEYIHFGQTVFSAMIVPLTVESVPLSVTSRRKSWGRAGSAPCIELSSPLASATLSKSQR